MYASISYYDKIINLHDVHVLLFLLSLSVRNNYTCIININNLITKKAQES